MCSAMLPVENAAVLCGSSPIGFSSWPMVSTPPRFGVGCPTLRRRGRHAGAISEGYEPHPGGAEKLSSREVAPHVSLRQSIDFSATVTSWSMIRNSGYRSENIMR